MIGPLLFLIITDHNHELVRKDAKDAIDFHIVLFIAVIVAALLAFVLVGFLLLPLIGVIDVVFVLIATVKANNGKIYEYPFTPSIV